MYSCFMWFPGKLRRMRKTRPHTGSKTLAPNMKALNVAGLYPLYQWEIHAMNQ